LIESVWIYQLTADPAIYDRSVAVTKTVRLGRRSAVLFTRAALLRAGEALAESEAGAS
jgi:hypothetical protein